MVLLEKAFNIDQLIIVELVDQTDCGFLVDFKLSVELNDLEFKEIDGEGFILLADSYSNCRIGGCYIAKVVRCDKEYTDLTMNIPKDIEEKIIESLKKEVLKIKNNNINIIN